MSIKVPVQSGWDVKGRLSTADAKAKFIECIAKGYTVAQAAEAIGRHPKTCEAWRAKDKDFAAAIDRIRLSKKVGTQAGVDIGYTAFAEKYLGTKVFPHTQNVVDLIEGREPGWLAAGMIYERGDEELVIVNMPPEHAKTTSITINYSTYRIATDANTRVIVVSKTQGMARKMLGGIKTRLTHPKYADLIAAYGPPGGFDHNSEAWNQDRIYLSGDVRDSGEKDPTVEALGIRGHIYGSRAELIILDDCVDNTNAHEYAKQIDWIQTEVLSRLGPGGVLLIVGTRLAPKDLYSEIRKPEYYPDDESPWTYLGMPAVLQADDDPEKWVTLWPKSNLPEVTKKAYREPGPDGLYPKWDGPALLKKRARMKPAAWARVYQQQQVSGQEIFDPDAINASINQARRPGQIPRGMAGNRPEGMDGLIIVAGLDPASPSGYVAATCVGLDVKTQKRYVLDVWNRTNMTPDDIRQLIKDWTERYSITEWRIEKNAFQTMLTQDREVREFLAGRGAILREHFTGSNKWDADYGVTSLTMLWAGWENGNELIELPRTTDFEAGKALVEQLVTWQPDAPKGHKTDVVMALWFTELACRDRITAMTSYSTAHVANPFATPYDLERRMTVNMADYQTQMLMRPIGA